MTRVSEPIAAAFLFLILATTPLLACGPGSDQTGCEPPPPPPPLVKDYHHLPAVEPETSEPWIVTPQNSYGFCCMVDDVPRFHTAFGRNPERAAMQCQARIDRLITLPDCPKDIADAVRRADDKGMQE